MPKFLTLLVESRPTFDPVIPVRWCLSPEALKLLQEKQVKNPRVLIISWSEKNHHQQRWLVPLEQTIQYVEFHQPGKNKIFATIVWDNKGSTYELWKHYLTKTRGDYDSTLIYEEEGKLRDDLGEEKGVGYSLGRDEIEVFIGAEFFAKEPPDREKRWVNRWFKTKAADQCEFRQRRLIAYSIQPLLVFSGTIFKITFYALAGILLFAFGRKPTSLSFKPLFHPWRSDIDEVWNSDKSRDMDSKWYFTKVYNFLFRPGCLLALFLLLYFANLYWLHLFPNIWKIISTIIGLAIVLSLAFWLATACISLVESIEKKQQKRPKWQIKKEREQERKQRELTRLQQYYEQLDYLGCRFVKEDKILDIPQKTLRLRFQKIKAKVCRPYAW